jgi:hypothetical protein
VSHAASRAFARPSWGAAGLAGAVVTSLLLAAGGSSRRLPILVPASLAGFPEWMRGPLSGFGPALSATTAAWLLVALSGCYGLVLARVRELSLRPVLIAIGCAQLAFMLAAPLYSADIFGYLDYARLGVLHHVDPYLHGAAAAPHDAVRPYVRWRDAPTPYGPLFTLGTYPLARLDLPAAFWTLKLLSGAASLGCVALVARIARQLDRPVLPAVLFVGLNPVLLAYGVGGGHNDFFAALAMLTGVSLALSARHGAASAVLVAAAAIKASLGLALPFMLLARRSRRALGATLLSVATVAALAAIGLGFSEWNIVRRFAGQQSVVARLSVPNAIGALLGLGGATPALRALLGLALCAGLSLLLWRVWRGADWLRMAGWATLLVLLASAWLLPWYIVWLLPLAAVAGDARLRTATLALTAYVVTMHVAAHLT